MPTHKRIRRRKNKTRKAVCSPGKKDNKFTCYSNKALHKLKQLWNIRHPDAYISTSIPSKIWSALQQNMNDICNTEQCWIRQQFSKNKINADLIKETFAPTAPKIWKKNPNEWLNSMDIEKVMKQHERAMPNFVFIGPSPIDFDTRHKYGECVWNELCNFDLKKHISTGKNKIGMIFNLDPHYKPGCHWFSTFVDIQKKYIFYIDSTCDKMPKEIRALTDRIIAQGKDLGINFTLHENDFEHQYANTECGMYSLYINIELLYGRKTPAWLMKNRVPDKDMELLRKKYFNYEE